MIGIRKILKDIPGLRRMRYSKLWDRIRPFCYLSVRERFLNWFVHRVIYGMRMKFSLHFTSRVQRPERIRLGKNAWRTLAINGGVLQ